MSSPRFRALVLKPKPHPNDCIPARGGEMIVIRGPGYTGHNISMTSVDEQRLTKAGIPDLHGLIPTSRGEALPIGRPGHAFHFIAMAFVGEQGLPTACIPH